MKRTLLLENGNIYTPQGIIRGGSMLVEDGKIEYVGDGGPRTEGQTETRNIHGLVVIPGFMDVHVHGALGCSVMDGTYESLDQISKFHAMNGTTSFLATTTTGSHEKIDRALRNAAVCIDKGLSGAQPIGIHLEGPFISMKRRGAQNPKYIREPKLDELEGYLDAANGHMRMVTLAPEVPGGNLAVEMLSGRGITVSIGHSDATYEQVVETVRLGASHTTHHFNGMSPLHHRGPGVAGAGLIVPKLTTELIADGIHVHPAVVKLLFEVKGEHNVCMITDAVSCAGLPDGEYDNVFMSNGQIYLKDGSSLAGSSLTTIQALKNVMKFTEYPLEKILPSLTSVPARQAKAADRKGSLEAGKDADFLIVDKDLNIFSTFVGGVEVYSSSKIQS